MLDALELPAFVISTPTCSVAQLIVAPLVVRSVVFTVDFDVPSAGTLAVAEKEVEQDQ